MENYDEDAYFPLGVELCWLCRRWQLHETFNNVSVVDVSCSKKAAADADAHTRTCALQCQKSGFGILTADKKFLKFDADGNAKMLAGTEGLRQEGPPSGECQRRCAGRHAEGGFGQTAVALLVYSCAPGRRCCPGV